MITICIICIWMVFSIFWIFRILAYRACNLYFTDFVIMFPLLLSLFIWSFLDDMYSRLKMKWKALWLISD